MPRKRKRSEKIALFCLAAGILAGGACYHWVIDDPWWISVFVGVLFAVGLHRQGMRDAATKNLADRD